ncbi:MAG: hypothetical protein M3R13_10185 [Armatimonadota bacterium]|nr:hypothetical protein [Armatimonadota bacterium]
MRRLKVLTTVFFVIGTCVLLSYPFTVGASPAKGAEKADVKAYLIRLTTYFGASTFAMLAAAFCATLMVRKTKLEFAEEKLGNLEQLIVTQAESLRKKPDESE